MKTKLLIVEDDPSFGLVLKSYLELNDFEVQLCNDGQKGVDQFKKGKYDLCILDVMMPVKDGFTAAKEIKAYNKDQPIIFLTAKTLKEDVLTGFEMGAEDYITKPFDTEILLVKIKAILKRNQPATPEIPKILNFGKFVYDTSIRNLQINGLEFKLSPKEGELLVIFVMNLNEVVSRSDALNKIWGNDDYFTARSMDVYIAKLRKYLKEDTNLSIVNIQREGFMLKLEE